MSGFDRPRKIAILGGGCASLTAAFELTRKSDWKKRYDITVYQMGWRLGGKGASGRNQRACKGLRIEEHGLHVWGGFYHNAFRLMDECYRDLGRPSSAPLSQLFQPLDGRRADNGLPAGAFKPQRNVVLMECLEGKNPGEFEWVPWCINFPSAPYDWMEGQIGIAMHPGGNDAEAQGIFDYIPMLATFLYQFKGGHLTDQHKREYLPGDVRGIELPDWIDDRLRQRLNEWNAPTDFFKPVGPILDLVQSIDNLIEFASRPDKDIGHYDLREIPFLIPPFTFITPQFVRMLLRRFVTEERFDSKKIAEEWGRRITLSLALAQNIVEEELREEVGTPPVPPDYPPAPRVLSLMTQSLRESAQLLSIGYLLTHADFDEHASRRMILLSDMITAVTEGMAFDFVWMLGFESIDNVEFRQWLRNHGAQEETLNSAVVMPAYDYTFAFRNGNVGDIQSPGSSPRGDARNANLAAGTALKGALQLLFRYSGAIFWEMEAGMGDVVFAPMYEVLKKRGVKFKFFHRIEKLHLSNDGHAISRISGLEQMTVKSGGEYQPLIDVDGLPCWPSEPKYDSLNKGNVLRQKYRMGDDTAVQCPDNSFDLDYSLESVWNKWDRTDRTTINEAAPFALRRGIEFDDIVLGISIGAFPDICDELINESTSWRNMVSHIEVVPTIAMQLWLSKPTKELGWPPRLVTDQPRPGSESCGNDPPILTGFAHRLNTWADLSHLAWTGNVRGHEPVEKWQSDDVVDTPKSVAYFCGPMTWPGIRPTLTNRNAFLAAMETPKSALEAAKEHAKWWIEHHRTALWPDPDAKSDFFKILVAPDGKAGEDRLAHQYFRANVNPSDLYVMSPRGSTDFRLRADESGFENLYLAGDWVRTSLNAGCVESAVMAGQAAAQAIGGEVPGGFLHWLAYLAGEITGATAVITEEVGEGVVDSMQSDTTRRRR